MKNRRRRTERTALAKNASAGMGGLWACGSVGLWAKRKPSKEAMWNCAFMMERM